MNGFRFLRRPSNDGRPEHTKVESSKRLSGIYRKYWIQRCSRRTFEEVGCFFIHELLVAQLLTLCECTLQIMGI